MKHLKTLFLFIVAIGINHSQAQIKILKDSLLGEYSVGFKNETLIDYSRSFGDSYRPIELFVWYPSNEKSHTTMLYSDYLKIQNNYVQPKIEMDSIISNIIKRSGLTENTSSLLENFKALKTSAYKDISIANGQFPLILFAPGGRTAGYLHSVICEYLASYGYIVVGLTALGNDETSRWPFDQTGLNLQIDDMAFTINHLKHKMAQINIDEVCLTSWSVGGVAQTIYAMKNSNIDLLVSLDSGIGRTYGVDMIKESPYFNYNKIDIPYLHFTGTQPEQFKVERSTELYDSIPATNKHLKVITAFAHQHFTSQNGIINDLISETDSMILSDSYLKMCFATRIFIDAFLKNDSEAKNTWIDSIITK